MTSSFPTRAARRRAAGPLACALALLAARGAGAQDPAPSTGPTSAPALAQQAEVRRTAHGVPHIRAANLAAAAYALAYVQLEDHGPSVALGLLQARGEMKRVAFTPADVEAQTVRRHRPGLEP